VGLVDNDRHSFPKEDKFPRRLQSSEARLNEAAGAADATRAILRTAESRLRWKHLHEFQQSLAQLQSVYCLTVHRSQGSTFQTAFLDLPDIRRREKTNLLEAQQMLYVAVTRPSQRLIVVGN
jgi:ATP-dependent exoDNAse (exonuclease V) alpha subunit